MYISPEKSFYLNKKGINIIKSLYYSNTQS